MPRIHRAAAVLALAALLPTALLIAVRPMVAAPVTAAPKTLELGRGPTVVIFHALGSSRMTWMPTARKLIDRYRVVLVDLPGHGDSALPDPFTLDAAAEALDQVLARQNPDSTVLVGHGLGGMLALLDLKAHPRRVKGLMVIEAGLKSPMKIEDQQIKYFVQQLDENYAPILKMLFGHMGRDSLQSVAIHATAMQAPARTMKAYITASLTADASGALKALEVPFEFVGTDRLFKDKDWATVGKDLGYENPAGVPTRRIGNAGYLVMQDQPDTLAVVISDFAKQVLAAKK